MTVQQLLAPVIAQHSWQVSTEEVAPLPDGDRAGIMVLFAGMGMMLAGYIPLSLMVMARLPCCGCAASCRCWPAGPRSPARSSG